jgi:hypothetical protein
MASLAVAHLTPALSFLFSPAACAAGEPRLQTWLKRIYSRMLGGIARWWR